MKALAIVATVFVLGLTASSAFARSLPHVGGYAVPQVNRAQFI